VLQPEFKIVLIEIVLSLAYTQYLIMSKWNNIFRNFYYKDKGVLPNSGEEGKRSGISQ
jgi:hypothetical protein